MRLLWKGRRKENLLLQGVLIENQWSANSFDLFLTTDY